MFQKMFAFMLVLFYLLLQTQYLKNFNLTMVYWCIPRQEYLDIIFYMMKNFGKYTHTKLITLKTVNIPFKILFFFAVVLHAFFFFFC